MTIPVTVPACTFVCRDFSSSLRANIADVLTSVHHKVIRVSTATVLIAHVAISCISDMCYTVPVIRSLKVCTYKGTASNMD